MIPFGDLTDIRVFGVENRFINARVALEQLTRGAKPRESLVARQFKFVCLVLSDVTTAIPTVRREILSPERVVDRSNNII